jgi:hypothetical protein
MFNEHVNFFKAIRVEQQVEALARGQLSASVLRLNAILATAQTGNSTALFEFFNNISHDVSSLTACMKAIALINNALL